MLRNARKLLCTTTRKMFSKCDVAMKIIDYIGERCGCPDFACVPEVKDPLPPSLFLYINKGERIITVTDFAGNTCSCPPGFAVLTEEILEEPFERIKDAEAFLNGGDVNGNDNIS